MHDPFAPEPIEFRRPRLAGDVLSDSLAFMRGHLVGIGRSLLYIAGPPFLLLVIAGIFLQDEAAAVNPLLNPEGIFDPEAVAVPFGPVYYLFFLFSTLTVLLAYAVGFAYALLYVEDPEEPIGVDEVWRKAKKVIAPLFLYPLGFYLLVLLSIVVVFVPVAGWIAWPLGFIYAVPIMWMTLPARLVGGRGFFAAIGRARRLVKGYWWQTLWLIVLVVVLSIVAVIALSVPSMVIGAVVGGLGGGEVDLLSRVILTLNSLFGGLSYLLYVFLAVSSIMHYFNLVTKQEGAAVPDLEDRIDAIGQRENTGWDDDGWDEEADAVRRW